MNRRLILSVLGKIMIVEAALMLLPCITAVVYREFDVIYAFAIPIAMLVVLGFLFASVRVRTNQMYPRDGFAMVAIAWIALSFFGALPFTISGQIPSLVDAMFESVSGFTTTGASILTDVEALSKCMLFWRSFTHWVGGMGVLVFVMTIIPLSSGNGQLHLVRAESTGPDVGKLVPRTKDSARILYAIYAGMTIIELVLLKAGGMKMFDSLCITFGTAGTGGFGVLNSSAASYSTYCQIVITIFMALFGVNFNIYFLLLTKKFKEAFRSEELLTYFGIFFAFAIIIALDIRHLYDSTGKAILDSFFQVSSIMTTTGFSTTDFDLWPELSKYMLLLLMCIGSCAGSTGGGLKISRLCILIKSAGIEIRKLMHPRSVHVVRFEGKRVSEKVLNTAQVYFVIYMMIIFISCFIVSFDKMDFTTNFSAVLATFNNIGPGLAKVGPTLNYSNYSVISKLVLTADMLFGRLEIFPLLMLFSPDLLKNLKIRRNKTADD